MKKGDQVKGPAIVRQRYKDDWEYSLLFNDGTHSPFGHSPPRGVKWVYQRTWKNAVQRIHVVTAADLESLGMGPVKERECWWNNPKLITDTLRIALKAHTQNPPKLEL